MEENFILSIKPEYSTGIYRVFLRYDNLAASETFTLRELFQNGPDDLFRQDSIPTRDTISRREFGNRLFDAVIKKSLREIFFQYLGERPPSRFRARIWLNLTMVPELEKISWESLYLTETFSAHRVYIFRFTGYPVPTRLSGDLSFTQKPVRILAAVSSSKNLLSNNIEPELSELKSALHLLETEKLVQTVFLETPSKENLAAALDRGRSKNPYQILYFVGDYSGESGKFREGLFIKDRNGEPTTLTAEEFGQMLDLSDVRLVMLDAKSDEKSLSDFGRETFRQHSDSSIIINQNAGGHEFADRFAAGLEREMIFGNGDFFSSMIEAGNPSAIHPAMERLTPPIIYSAPHPPKDLKLETLKWDTLGGDLRGFEFDDLINHRVESVRRDIENLSLNNYSRKNFYFNLEGESARGNAVEFGTLVDLVFGYDVPPRDAAAIIYGNILNQARLNNLSLNITVIPVGFSFTDAPGNSYSRRISFKNGLMTEAARFRFRAAKRETLTEISEQNNREISYKDKPETGFHIIFNVRGLTFEQLFLPVRLVDSIESDSQIRFDYEPLRFDLDLVQEFSEMADKTNDKMKKLVDEILTQKETS